MKDSMKTWLNPVCVVIGIKCSTCSSLTHLGADFPVRLKSQEKSTIQQAVLQKQTQAAWERGEKKKKKAKDTIENYFRKHITLHYFSHQFWLVFISISSRLVETWPIPSLWDATKQSFLTALRYSHAYLKAEALGHFLWLCTSAMPLLRPRLPGRGVGGIQLSFVFKINIFIHHLNAHIINSYAPAAVLSLIFSSPPCYWLTLLQDLLGENVWDLRFPWKWSNHFLLL